MVGVKIMKRAMIIASLGLASVLSFGASAAVHQVNAEQAQNLQSMGTISVSQVGSAPMDMRQELAAKAEKEGASSYRIEARTGDSWHATAELYK
jgi:protein-disulfide isomerase